MYLVWFFGVAFMLLGLENARSQVAIEWVADSSGLSIAVDSEDNVFTINYEYNPAGDIYLFKRDRNGRFLWVASYNNTDNTRHEVSTWVATDRAGNAIVSGTIRSGYSNPVNAASLLMKFDPDGHLLWRRVYENSFDGSYTKKCLVDDDNNIYVLGMGSGPKGYTMKVKKFSPAGDSIWTYHDTTGIGAPVNFKFTPDGDIILVGRGIIGSVNGYARIDTAGHQQWAYAPVFSLTVGDAAGDAYGNTYLVHGEYNTGTGSQIKKINSNGQLIWNHTYSLSAFRIEVGSDNEPVICGFPNPNQGGAAFLKTDSSGQTRWMNLDADSGRGLLLHAQLMMDESNNIYLAAGTLFEMAVCKVLYDGSSAWTMLMPRSYANAFVLGRYSDIFVTGGATVKLSQGKLTGNVQAEKVPKSGLHLFPVPASSEINIMIPKDGTYSCTIFNTAGRSLAIKNVLENAGQTVRFDISDLPSGTYIICLSDSHSVYTARFIVRH